MNQNLRLVGLVALPFLIVHAVRLLLGGGGPSASNAAPIETTITLPAPFEAPTLSEPDREIVAWIDAQPTPTRSPMASPNATAPGERPPRENRVTAVIGRGANAIANIDGSLYRVGDELEPGWTIRRIDGLTVELVDHKGTTRTLGTRP